MENVLEIRQSLKIMINSLEVPWYNFKFKKIKLKIKNKKEEKNYGKNY